MVVYVNNVYITTLARICRYTPAAREKQRSFAKGRTFFIMYISLCFYTFKGKKIMLKEIYWFSMYSKVSSVCLWRRVFVDVFSFLYSSLLMFPLRLWLSCVAVFCRFRVLRSLHSLQVAVCKFVLLWVRFYFVFLLHRSSWMTQRSKVRNQKRK